MPGSAASPSVRLAVVITATSLGFVHRRIATATGPVREWGGLPHCGHPQLAEEGKNFFRCPTGPAPLWPREEAATGPSFP